MSDVEKQAKKEYQKSYHKKLMAYQDELLLEELKRDKKKTDQLIQEIKR